MNEEQKNQKLKYLREQRDNPTGDYGDYRKYLVNTYNYILNDSKINNRGWSRASTREMINFIYEGTPDHMGYELVDEYKKTLRDLGYIKFVKEKSEWHTYVVKELDF